MMRCADYRFVLIKFPRRRTCKKSWMNLSVIPAEAGIHSFQIHSQIRKRRGRAKILTNAHVGFKDGLKAKLVFGRNEHKACQLNPRPQTLAGGAHPSKLRITLSSIPFHME